MINRNDVLSAAMQDILNESEYNDNLFLRVGLIGIPARFLVYKSQEPNSKKLQLGS